MWSPAVWFLLFATVSCQVQFRVPRGVFSDGMVLQMAPKSAYIWGWGQKGATIEISLNDEVIVTTRVPDDSHWTAVVPPQEYGGPHMITISHFASKGPREIMQFVDVMFGDVWVCAGEGNMEFAMENIVNSSSEIEHALLYSGRFHLMQVSEDISLQFELDELAKDPKLPWQPLSQDNVGDFSAVCLLYAERIADALGDNRIFGLVSVTWVGSTIEAWVSSRVLDTCSTPPSLAGSLEQQQNSAIWNGMVRPVAHMSVRGVLWSQGESNIAYNLPLYTCHLRYLIEDWKMTFPGTDEPTDAWGFPFGIVQLGTMEGEDVESVSLLRYHQTLDTTVVPNGVANESFLAAAYDLHDPTSPMGSVYYRDKQTVADRLSLAARFLIYNQTNNVEFVGPIPSIVWDYETSVMNVSYSRDVRILNTPGQPSGFSYQGPDKEWVSAPLIGVFEDTLSFYVHPNYTHVAYAWSDVPCERLACSVYSVKNQLPHITELFPMWGQPIL